MNYSARATETLEWQQHTPKTTSPRKAQKVMNWIPQRDSECKSQQPLQVQSFHVPCKDELNNVQKSLVVIRTWSEWKSHLKKIHFKSLIWYVTMYNKDLYNVMKKEHTRSGPRPQQLDLPSPPQIEIVCVQKSQMLHPAHPLTDTITKW